MAGAGGDRGACGSGTRDREGRRPGPPPPPPPRPPPPPPPPSRPHPPPPPPVVQVLLLLPQRNIAFRWVTRLLALALRETRTDSVQGRERFVEEFGPDEGEEGEGEGARPAALPAGLRCPTPALLGRLHRMRVRGPMRKVRGPLRCPLPAGRCLLGHEGLLQGRGRLEKLVQAGCRAPLPGRTGEERRGSNFVFSFRKKGKTACVMQLHHNQR